MHCGMKTSFTFEEQERRWQAKFRNWISCPELITAPTDEELTTPEAAAAKDEAERSNDAV